MSDEGTQSLRSCIQIVIVAIALSLGATRFDLYTLLAVYRIQEWISNESKPGFL
jgi:hypothetical protein